MRSDTRSPNHIRQGRRLAVFAAAPRRKSVGVKIGLAIELNYARGDHLRMLPGLLCMLKKFGLDSLGIHSGRPVEMTLVPPSRQQGVRISYTHVTRAPIWRDSGADALHGAGWI